MATKPTVWPIHMFGVTAIVTAVAVGVIAWTAGSWSDLTLILFIIGVVAIRVGFESSKAARARASSSDRAAAPDRAPARRRRVEAPPEPPRIGNDPFRDPPGSPPIIVASPPAPPAPPIVPGAADDVPRHLA